MSFFGVVILGWWWKIFSSSTGYDFKEGSIENWCLGLSKKGQLNKDFCYDAQSLLKGCTRPAKSLYLRHFPYLRCFGWTEKIRNFLGDPFRKRSRIHRIWFDCGYLYSSAHEVMGDKGVDRPVVMPDSLVQTAQKPVEALLVQFLTRLWWMCLSLYNDRCQR